jgi:hypothetical protein
MTIAFIGGIGAFELLIIFVPAILWLWALIDVLRSEFRDSSTKVVWLIAIIFVPFLGAILYFGIGRRQKIA